MSVADSAENHLRVETYQTIELIQNILTPHLKNISLFLDDKLIENRLQEATQLEIADKLRLLFHGECRVNKLRFVLDKPCISKELYESIYDLLELTGKITY